MHKKTNQKQKKTKNDKKKAYEIELFEEIIEAYLTPYWSKEDKLKLNNPNLWKYWGNPDLLTMRQFTEKYMQSEPRIMDRLQQIHTHTHTHTQKHTTHVFFFVFLIFAKKKNQSKNARDAKYIRVNKIKQPNKMQKQNQKDMCWICVLK